MTGKKCIIVLYCLLCAFSVYSQKTTQEVSFLKGNFISHENRRTAKNSMHNGISYSILKPTYGKKYWQFAHNYPTMGLTATLRSFGNQPVYGFAFSVTPHLEFDIYKFRKGKISIKHGTGIALISKRFDSLYNPSNTIIGSKLNATSTLDIGVKYFANDYLNFKTGLALHHYSNGMVILPNAGVNTLSLYTTIGWHQKEKPDSLIKYEPFTQYNKWNYRLGFAIGFYDFIKNKNSLRKNRQMNLMAFYQHNTRFRTGLGMEIGYLLKSDFKTQFALYAEEEVQFANIVTRYGFGAYLNNLRFSGERFYSKIGMAYYPKLSDKIPKGFYIGMAMKAHNIKAAHIELSLGYLL